MGDDEIQAASGGVIVESKEWYISAYAPEGVPTSDHLKLRSVPISLAIDSIPDHHVALETLLISIDPYLHARMTGTEDGLYMPQHNLNEVFGIARVIESKDSNYTKGDIVISAFLPVAEFAVLPSDLLARKIDTTPGISLTDYLSSLDITGVPGFSAWVGIEVVAQPKPGSNVFISSAAGGVGMYAGQLAKLKGCRVIGSTGSEMTSSAIIGYIPFYFPDGIDVYLDNVGGEMLEAVLNHVNKHAHIILCGMISQYNKVWTERYGVRNLLNMIGKEVKMEGFLIGSYLDRFPDFTKDMESYIKQGKITCKHMIYYGIDSFLESLGSLFSSSNIGKVVIQVKSLH
ncbi:hypothetical protein EZV62_020629 [Acer yangbiense]|uniref:Enoyl reductase (ER) domain-containing protein n=1 Tax=Acer yangbiense TaxID=1000413 RepID=A0A5C7HDZ3_9ROSI|nr:hypothetical protein EZV62_020629 [Acer yangbiense]